MIIALAIVGIYKFLSAKTSRSEFHRKAKTGFSRQDLDRLKRLIESTSSSIGTHNGAGLSNEFEKIAEAENKRIALMESRTLDINARKINI